jgi:Reversibly glycosylated polypeptide
MKIALCTTTINMPRVLELYRACAQEPMFFIAGDMETPGGHVSLMRNIGRFVYLDPCSQNRWKCSELLGWNTLARRNIAFLEALKDGAEVIVSIDDDNSPLNSDYFWTIETKIFRPFKGLCARSGTGWFDAGQLLVPWAKHRGIPHKHHSHIYNPVTNVKIGVMAGLVLGDSDVDATTRMEQQPDTQVVSELARSGVVVNLNTHTVFNSQNTALIRELVPAWFMMPGIGRYDDIYASLIAQRVAKERELHVHFGQPFVHQQRNPHDLVKDLRAEIDGMENVSKLADLLDHIVLPAKSVIEDVRIIYEQLCFCQFIPQESATAGLVWLEDCETAL